MDSPCKLGQIFSFKDMRLNSTKTGYRQIRILMKSGIWSAAPVLCIIRNLLFMPLLSNRWLHPFFILLCCDSLLVPPFCLAQLLLWDHFLWLLLGVNVPWSSALNPLLSLYCLLKPSGHTISWFQSHLNADRTQTFIFSWGNLSSDLHTQQSIK